MNGTSKFIKAEYGAKENVLRLTTIVCRRISPGDKHEDFVRAVNERFGPPA